MTQRGAGKIMIIASGAAFVGIPGYSAYCASNYVLKGYAAALRLEAAPHGINVSICFPPDTLTRQFEQEIGIRPAEANLFIGKARLGPGRSEE